jgi:hypothetical protein
MNWMILKIILISSFLQCETERQNIICYTFRTIAVACITHLDLMGFTLKVVEQLSQQMN